MDHAGGPPPAGWYRAGDVLRWWDGQQWTSYTAPLTVPPPARPAVADDRAMAWLKAHKLIAAAMVALPVLLLVSAVLAGTLIASPTTQPPSAGPPASPTRSATSTTPTPTASPSAAATPPSAPSSRSSPSSTHRRTPTPTPATITGYGATRSAWLSAHQPAPGYRRGFAFLPMVERDGNTHPMYAAVLLGTPVLSYLVNLPEGTDLDEAKRIALAEFPPGAKFGAEEKEPRCLLTTVRSRPVQAVMRKHGYGGFVPLVVFFTTTATSESLDPNNITEVDLLFTKPGHDLGNC